MEAVESWIDASPINLVLVVGTSSAGFAPGYFIELARAKGARLAVVNTDRDDEPPDGLQNRVFRRGCERGFTNDAFKISLIAGRFGAALHRRLLLLVYVRLGG